MQRTPPEATAPSPMTFGTCNCGRRLAPNEGTQCEVCLRAKNYFGGTNEPNGPATEPTPTYGRPT